MSGPTQDIFESALLRPADGQAARLTWRAPRQGGRLVQVYVNGRLHEATVDPRQRELWLHPASDTPAFIELLAVDPADAWTDFHDALDGWSPMFVSAAALAVLRDESLPPDAMMVVTVDGVEQDRGPLWSPADGRIGFGGLFGMGGFGWDDAAAPGFALGEFGLGRLGFDGIAWRWWHDRLAEGEHEVRVTVVDRSDRVLATLPAPFELTIDRPPTPAGHLRIKNNELHWRQ